jgi:hypothetical protein
MVPLAGHTVATARRGGGGSCLKKPKREEWREARCKITHVPTEFWMTRHAGRPEPALRSMFPDVGEYDLDDLINMGTVLLKEQWEREVS